MGEVSQLREDGGLAHLLTLEGLPRTVAERLFRLADGFVAGRGARVEGVGGGRGLRGRLVVNIFFESSTRTRTAFEAAAKQLGADVVNLDQIRMAGETKKESLQDTVRTVAAMGAAGIVLRHGQDGAARRAAVAAEESGVAIINGGDGCNQHPTQGLSDVYTLLRRFGAERLPQLRVAIVGDVLHSRVARSNLCLLRTMGVADVRLAGPVGLCPPALSDSLGAPVFNAVDSALEGVDVVMLLRIQRERLAEAGVEAVGGMAEAVYLERFGLTAGRAARLPAHAVVMHPGPINRGVEIADEVADGARSLILQQVRLGMAIRMAVLTDIMAGFEGKGAGARESRYGG